MAYQRFSLFPDSPSFKDLFSARSLRYRWRNGDPVITTAIMAICIVVWAIEAVLFLVWPEGGNAFVNAGMLLPATAVRHPGTFITSCPSRPRCGTSCSTCLLCGAWGPCWNA